MFDLKGFRKANKISQTELAEFLGVGQGFISQMEKGTRPIPDAIAEKILNNPQWIVEGKVSSSLSGELISEEEDLRNECEVLRNKIAHLEQTIFAMVQQVSGKDFIEQNGGEGNIGKYVCDSENAALKKEIELLRSQLEEMMKRNTEYWEVIRELMQKK